MGPTACERDHERIDRTHVVDGPLQRAGGGGEVGATSSVVDDPLQRAGGGGEVGRDLHPVADDGSGLECSHDRRGHARAITDDCA